MPRIRTIKPEYWTHPVYARASDEVRLGAIGLISHADDKGYVLVSPEMIRSNIWPFDEDSSRARRVIDELIKLGWLEVRFHCTHGAIGRIVNFNFHQRIDRASESKLKPYFINVDSPNPLRISGESSCSDQGTGKKEQVREGGVTGDAGPSPCPPPPPSGEDKTLIKNQKINKLKTALRRWGFSVNDEAVREWADVMQGRGQCITIGEVLDGVEWIGQQVRKSGPKIQYAREASALIDSWSKIISQGRGAAAKGDAA